MNMKQDYCIYCHSQITYEEGLFNICCPVCGATFPAVQLRGYQDELKDARGQQETLNRSLQEKQAEINLVREKALQQEALARQEKESLLAEKKQVALEQQKTDRQLKDLLGNLDKMDELGSIMRKVAGKQDSAGEQLTALVSFAERMNAANDDFNIKLQLMMEYGQQDKQMGEAIFSLLQSSDDRRRQQLDSVLSACAAIRESGSASAQKQEENSRKLDAVDAKLEKIRSDANVVVKKLEDEAASISGQLQVIASGISGLNDKMDRNRQNKVEAQFLQANELKARHRFDDAYRQYQRAIEESGADILNPAELHWRQLLCRYGVEYVYSDYDKGSKPTLYRISNLAPASQTEEARHALESCTQETERQHYTNELKKLDEIIDGYTRVHYDLRYDVFISVKQQDGGVATEDSDKARALWAKLTQSGYNVFNSAISQIPPGENYEPYILAALRSSRVMILVGGKPAYLEKSWVKNEWGRFLWMKENEPETRLLLPYLFGQMRANLMPREIQSRNIQAIQEGIGSDDALMSALASAFPERRKNKPDDDRGSEDRRRQDITESKIKKAETSLEIGEFEDARITAQSVLENQDPQNARCYLILLLAEYRLNDISQLSNCGKPFEQHKNFKYACHYADAALKSVLDDVARQARQTGRVTPPDPPPTPEHDTSAETTTGHGTQTPPPPAGNISLYLTDPGSDIERVRLIAEIHKVTNAELSVARRMAESTPVLLKENLSEQEAGSIAARFTALGAKTSITAPENKTAPLPGPLKQETRFSPGDFSVYLTDPGDIGKRIQLIVEIRRTRPMEPNAARKIADSVPALLIDNISKQDAESIAARFTALGAKTSITTPEHKTGVPSAEPQPKKPEPAPTKANEATLQQLRKELSEQQRMLSNYENEIRQTNISISQQKGLFASKKIAALSESLSLTKKKRDIAKANAEQLELKIRRLSGESVPVNVPSTPVPAAKSVKYNRFCLKISKAEKKNMTYNNSVVTDIVVTGILTGAVSANEDAVLYSADGRPQKQFDIKGVYEGKKQLGGASANEQDQREISLLLSTNGNYPPTYFEGKNLAK